MSTEQNEKRQLQQMTIRLFADDLEFLRVAYQSAGYNRIIRGLVSQHVKRLKNLTLEKLEGAKLTAEELGNV